MHPEIEEDTSKSDDWVRYEGIWNDTRQSVEGGISESDGRVCHVGKCNGTHQCVEEGISENDSGVCYNGYHHQAIEESISESDDKSLLTEDKEDCNRDANNTISNWNNLKGPF